MRYLVISDVHANADALQAVLSDAAGKYERLINCGDLVGYGPEPNLVLELNRAAYATVRGNHDKACAGLADLEWFNDSARAAVEWTQRELTGEHLEWLRQLARGPLVYEGFQLLHGSPGDEDEYLISAADAHRSLPVLECHLSFFGHTHVQGGFWVHRGGARGFREREVHLEQDRYYLVNPGSVGQPRDGDPRAAYALFDSEHSTVSFRRVLYDVERTQSKMRLAGLPEILAQRLAAGL